MVIITTPFEIRALKPESPLGTAVEAVLGEDAILIGGVLWLGRTVGRSGGFSVLMRLAEP